VPRDDEGGFGLNFGKAMVLEWVDNFWNVLGNELLGSAADDYFGFAVALSSNGRRLSVSAPYNDTGGDRAGQVRAYSREEPKQALSPGILWFITKGSSQEDEPGP